MLVALQLPQAPIYVARGKNDVPVNELSNVLWFVVILIVVERPRKGIAQRHTRGQHLAQFQPQGGCQAISN